MTRDSSRMRPGSGSQGPHPRANSSRDPTRRRRALWRQRTLAVAVLAAVGGAVAAVVTAGGSGSSGTVPHLNAAAAPDRLAAGDASMGLARSRTGPPFATGSITLRIVDHTRSVQLPNGQTVPRTLRTIVRYPASDRTRSGDLRGAAPARDAGPFPLIVFGHGFAVTPHLYARLLRAWAAAGYVVAAPVFPLGNADAPGGPNESDLPNQPADMSLVISRLLAASRATSGTLGGLISTHAIAVAGQSDGGDTALAVAYDPRYRDARVGAAIILSGAEIPGIGGFQIQAGGPPLLATQGSADTVNPPSATDAFYATAAVPKFLLTLPGATHLPPYSSQQPQLGVVERVTIAFLNHYLKRRPLKPLLSAGQVPGVAVLSAHP